MAGLNTEIAEIVRLQAANLRLREEIRHLNLELLWVTHRESDENAGRCFDNRRELAQRVAQALRVTEEEAFLMRKAAVDHGGTGGEIITWLVSHLRARVSGKS